MNNDFDNLDEIIPNLSPKLSAKFRSYFDILVQYNKTINLVSKNSIPRAASKHFFDCYSGINIIKELTELSETIFDFGSGNGFPGLIAAIMLPSNKLVLVERDQRKAEFLKSAASHLELKNVEVHAGGVNTLPDDSCKSIISRAMAPIPKFLLETRKVTEKGGEAFLFKSDYWSSELSAVPAVVFDHWDVEVVGNYELPMLEGDRYIIKCTRL